MAVTVEQVRREMLLRYMRGDLFMTDIARVTGASKVSVEHFMYGANIRNITPSSIHAICKALGIGDYIDNPICSAFGSGPPHYTFTRGRKYRITEPRRIKKFPTRYSAIFEQNCGANHVFKILPVGYRMSFTDSQLLGCTVSEAN